MTQEKKTEEQLRHDIRKEFSFSEKTDKDKIDSILETKKDAYKNRQKLKDIKTNVDPQEGNKENKEPEGKENYSLQDIRALSDVHDDNVEEIVNYAKFKNISIAEAKKSDTILIYLKNEKEKRKTAEVANTKPSRQGASGDGDKVLLEKESKGEDMTDDEFTRGAKARVEAKRDKNK